ARPASAGRASSRRPVPARSARRCRFACRCSRAPRARRRSRCTARSSRRLPSPPRTSAAPPWSPGRPTIRKRSSGSSSKASTRSSRTTRGSCSRPWLHLETANEAGSHHLGRGPRPRECRAGAGGGAGPSAAREAEPPASARRPDRRRPSRRARYRGRDARGRAFAKPLPIVVDGSTYELRPENVATAYVEGAVARARSATRGDNVALTVVVRGADVRAFVARLAEHVDRKGVPARLELRDGQPLIVGNELGRRLRQEHVVAAIVHSLTVSTRLPLGFRTARVPPAPTGAQIGAVVLINRSLNRLTWFDDGRLRRFPVATGQSIYPTPTGRFRIVVMWKDPWWYPPTYDSWARGLKPVPPGPGNPLGTRWMGLSAPGVGIHGTDDPSSIGYSVSHGC